jgi:hypothetical protein
MERIYKQILFYLMKISKIFCFVLITVFIPLSSCKEDSGKIIEQTNIYGNDIFYGRGNVDYFFFDDDNLVTNESPDKGTSFKRFLNSKSMVKSSDCYMIKSGDVDVLVDCGYQSSFYSHAETSNDFTSFVQENIKNNFESNLIKKIASICTDGVLDYLIVTHADFDHISSLIVDGGLFDKFLNEETVTSLDNKTNVKLKQISNIIDFDSPLVDLHSYKWTDSSQRLISSDFYQCYKYKRNLLISKKGTNYLPASALFDDSIVSDSGEKMSKEEKAKAIPDKVQKKISNAGVSGVDLILSQDNPNDSAKQYSESKEFKKNNSYSDNVKRLNGSLKYENAFYYVIPFNGNELRILYNWHYDYIFRSSFNSDGSGDETENGGLNFVSQDVNNISVCLEVVGKGIKFLGNGDLGGNGENSLLKYYASSQILSQITYYKASHHGSTYNGENSQLLFQKITPKVVIVTGCAQPTRDVTHLDPDGYESTNAQIGAPKLTSDFFTNLFTNSSGDKINDNTYVLCNNIMSYNYSSDNGYFISAPFYGDIHLSDWKLSYSYVGEVKGYISLKFARAYEEKNGKPFTFRTVESGKVTSFPKTLWYEKMQYLINGAKVEDLI